MMKIESKTALACIIGVLFLQGASCGNTPEEADANKWTCTCASAYQRNQTYAIAANCSAFCGCNPEEVVGESTGGRWTCLCAGEGFSEASRSIHIASCFNSYNCTSGIPSSYS
ncbi:hypothetical protein Sjap_013210 [Stephania japonica]|uniref:Uncharacterized protein n=1 Tax=Stephania japonica TaxID=461633 RepID=A0AAP0NYE4_9MAGN